MMLIIRVNDHRGNTAWKNVISIVMESVVVQVVVFRVALSQLIRYG